jgi:hypothetical protein
MNTIELHKWDLEAERLVIIEPTVGRTDWEEEIATLSGTNIPAIGYCKECGVPIPPSKSIPGVVWQGSYMERMRVGFGVVPSNATVVDGFWRRDDPFPALVHHPYEIMTLIRCAIRRLTQMLKGRD